ncbi:hypothetical protein Peur_062049 [Populus x canadensis]
MVWESPPSILVTRNLNWSQRSGTGTGCVKGRPVTAGSDDDGATMVFSCSGGQCFSAIVGSADGGGMAEALPFSSSSSAGWEEGDELRRDGGGVWKCWCSWRVTAAAPPPGVAAAAAVGLEEMMRVLAALVRLLVLLPLLGWRRK